MLPAGIHVFSLDARQKRSGMTDLLKRNMTAITLCSYRISLYIEAPPSLFFATDILCSLI
jgi:hypothetical protein